MNLLSRPQATIVVTLGANSHYTPLNFFRDYGVSGSRLVISSTANTAVLFSATKRQSPSLETLYATVERWPEDLTGAATFSVAGKGVRSLKAYRSTTIDFASEVDLVYVSTTTATTLTVTLMTLERTNGERINPDGRMAATTYPVFHPIANLTRHHATGAQVILDLGFWTDSVASPTYFRTNEVAVGAIVKTTGYSSVSVCFGRHVYGQVTYVPSVISVRKARTEAELWASDDNWTHNIQATTNGATTLFNNLEPGPWFIQWRIAHQPYLTNCTVACDSHAQAGVPWSDPTRTDPFIGYDFVGYETVGNGSFQTITWDMPTRNFLVLGDSNSGGPVYVSPAEVAAGAPSVNFDEPRYGLVQYGTVGPAAWHSAGGVVQWSQRVIHRWGRAHGYIPRILNNAFGGHWIASISTTKRNEITTVDVPSGRTSPWAGAYLDFIDCFKFRTNFVNTSYVAGTDWTGGLTMHGVMITSFYNDIIQACGLFDAGHYSADAALQGVTFKNNFALAAGPSLLESIFTQWPNAAVFVCGPHHVEGEFGVTTITDLRAAMATDVSYYNFTSIGGAKYNTNQGRFLVLSDLSGTTGIGTSFVAVSATKGFHLTFDDHVAIADAVYPTFDQLNFLL